jgi:hypothetical protein
VLLITSLFRRRRPASGEGRAVPPFHEANKALADALLRAPDVRSAGLLLVEEVVERLGVEFAALALISDDRRRASGLVAVEDGAEADWWPETAIDFENEPSAVATAASEAAPVFVYDVAASARVSRRLA